MIGKATASALLALALAVPAQAGVLSDADRERLGEYREIVLPAARELAPLRDLGAQIGALIAAAQKASETGSRFAPTFAAAEVPELGGPCLELMLGMLRSIRDPDAFAAPEWAAMLGEVKAEIDERLAYDAALLKAFQRNQGEPHRAFAFIGWEGRPDAAAHLRRFQATFDRRAAY